MTRVESATMNSAIEAAPGNINTAEVLEIKSPCSVTDAYQLICDRRNIKNVIVNGQSYTSQEVRNMPIDGQLGHGRPEPIGTVGDVMPAPIPPVEGIYEQLNRMRYEGRWVQPQTVQGQNAGMIIIDEIDAGFDTYTDVAAEPLPW